ncbi:hypothetical protein CVT26_012034 [Gymnopilus dilepis]|uniref:Cyanovirin-N domain-containing protein n=1 Tax=Gymnopilus dilepis TaxID=231916 RepID=A0A409WP04_9AGAR|nr:hypothetical protein CVT26_012034 [Gymnopilus dilepis]
MRLSVASIAVLAISALEAAAAADCWAPASTVTARFGPLKDLRTDARLFCNIFSSNVTGTLHAGGRYNFGYQSAAFIGNFANYTSCIDTFNTIVTDCYGAGSTSPTMLGGIMADEGGGALAISFGDGIKI